MTNQDEDNLRKRLADAYPLESPSVELSRKVTEMIKANEPTNHYRGSAEPGPSSTNRRRSWLIAATAAGIVAISATIIGMTITPGASSPAAQSNKSVTDSVSASSAQTDTASSVGLPTSQWVPGMGAMAAAGVGRLTVGADGCIYLDQSAVIWPKGFYGVRDSSGGITIYGPDSGPRAKTDTDVSFGGGWVGSDPEGCSSGADGPFLIEGELPVLVETDDSQ